MKGGSSSINLRHRLRDLLSPFWVSLSVLFAINLVATPIINLMIPVPLRIALDSLVGEVHSPPFLIWAIPNEPQDFQSNLLWFAVILSVLVVSIRLLTGTFQWLLSERIGNQMVLHLKSRLFERAQFLSLAYHETQGAADVLYRIQHDALAIQSLVLWKFIPFASSIVIFVAMMIVIFMVSVKLAFVATLVAPVFTFFAWKASKSLRSRWEVAKDLENRSYAVPCEVIPSLRLVKAFGQEQREQARFVERLGESMAAAFAVVKIESFAGLLMGLSLGLGATAVLYIGANEVRAQLLTVGEFVMVMAYLAALYDPLQTVGREMGQFQGPLVSLRRCFELLDQPNDVREDPRAIPLVRVKGDIELRDVTFSYSRGCPVISSVSMKVPAGTSVGIAGPTGSGKSTLAALLMRFYDPLSGSIKIDGQDIRYYRLSDLRRQFSVVLQESMLFSGTIRENIAYGKPTATDAEIVAAAEAAFALDFIERLPDGFRTEVGDRGMQLSGGERQRIALSRAFLKNSPILILDEPTSSVDTEAEEVIMRAIQRLMKGRTVFMIAHRLSTLSGCALRLRLENGRVAGDSWTRSHAASA
jgi:ATP-binding cassette subfamily B protein